MSNFKDFASVGAPQGREHKPHQHQVLINQSLLRRMEADVKELKEDIKSIKFAQDDKQCVSVADGIRIKHSV